MSVKRYDLFDHMDCGAIMNEDAHGSYVLHSDFAALAAENAAMMAGLEEAADYIESPPDTYSANPKLAEKLRALARKAAP